MLHSIDTITRPTTLYVETTGNDNNPGTQLMPFLTIQKAIDSVSNNLSALVTILVGIGNFSGFAVQGFNSVPTSPAGAGLVIDATLIAAAGASSGAISSITNGSLTAPSYLTLTDNTKAWATNEWKNKMIELPSSVAGTSQFLGVVGNDATTITLAVASLFGVSVGSTYAIRDFGTTIDTPIQAPVVAGGTSSTSTYGIWVGNNRSPTGTSIRLRYFKVQVSGSTSRSMNVECSQLTIFNCLLKNTGTGNNAKTLLLTGPSNFQMRHTIIDTTAVDGIVCAAPGISAVLTSCIFSSVGTAKNFTVLSEGDFALTSCVFDGGGFGVNVAGGNITLTHVRITNTSSQAIRIRSNNPTGTRSAPAVFLSVAGVEVSNCGTGVEASGLSFVDNSPGLFIGTGNTTGWLLVSGARVQVNASSTMTGSDEVSIDGSVTTLAAMRGNSPKLISSAYFSIIYE